MFVREIYIARFITSVFLKCSLIRLSITILRKICNAIAFVFLVEMCVRYFVKCRYFLSVHWTPTIGVEMEF